MLGDLIEDALPHVWVEGEISNFSRPASGHWYFTLKDENAQMRAVMFRNANYLVRPQPKNGDAVRIRAQVSIYKARGDLQLIAEHMEPAGEGELLRKFEALKKQLSAEGLFDEAKKKKLPAVPRRIGLITSATGAAIQDVRSTLERRFPLAKVYLRAVPVQGDAAAPAITKAIDAFSADNNTDVILLIRGGGSLEDLWAFNEEIVARAIARCPIPLVSGVGHETDFSIADFCADVRAATPTAAAEIATPDISEWNSRVQSFSARAHNLIRSRLESDAAKLLRLNQRMARSSPQRKLRDQAQYIDELAQRLQRNAILGLGHRIRDAANLYSRFQRASPDATIKIGLQQVAQHHNRLQRAAQLSLHSQQQKLNSVSAILTSMNPNAVLQRGYSISRNASGQIVRAASQLNSGDILDTQFHDGNVSSTVNSSPKK